jgi:uroporphyrinogen III methyltransferase / synthase
MDQESNPKDLLPLSGKTIVVTRALTQARNLSDGLEKLGAKIVVFPTIDIRLLIDTIPVGIDKVDWIVFTSANGVRGLHASVRAENLMQKFPRSRICCVGPGTESMAKKAGLNADLLPDIYTAGDVFGALEEVEGNLAGKKILLPRGNIANPNLRDSLVKAGVDVKTLIVYETECPPKDDDSVTTMLDAKPDMVTFTSASTARNFATLVGKEQLGLLKGNSTFASIGPQTSKAAVAKGMEILVEPSQHDIPGLIESIQKYYS